jgi:hypothetical protein
MDPQRLGLYCYGRNSPLRFVDPTGLDVEVIGSEKDAYVKRLQTIVSFKVQLDSKTNRVQIVDQNGKPLDSNALKTLGKSLKDGEKQLFNAITDTKNNAVINTVRKDSSVFFGSFDGNGKNTIDFGDVDTLDAPKNNGGFSAGQVVGHETLEAYASSKGDAYADAHDYANDYFGGLKEIPNTGAAYAGNAKTPNDVTHLSGEFSVIGSKGVKAKVFFELTTPIPIGSVQQHLKSGTKTPSHVVAVEKVP